MKDERFKSFLDEVRNSYNYSPLRFTDNGNIIVIVKNKEYIIDGSEVERYYEAFRKSGVPRNEWASRTAGRLKEIVKRLS